MRTQSLRLLSAPLAVVALAFAAEVSVDYNHHADFSRYKTYSWMGVQAGNSLWRDRIMSAVDGQLAAKGMTRVEGRGDIAVSAFGKLTETDTIETFYSGFPGWDWRGWAGMGTATSTVIPERVGNLMVDVFDGATKQLLWRGAASEVLSSKAEKNEKKMEEAVDKMFKKFPPESKG